MLEKQPISNVNLLLVDWLTFTTKIWSESELLSMLQLSHDIPWEELDAYRYGYKHRKTFSGMSILSDGQDSMGICVEFSGQGCRSFETYSSLPWLSLFEILMEPLNEFNITHIDLAFDDHTGILNLGQLLEDTDHHRYRSRSRWWKVEYGSCGTTIYHGSPQSNIRVRIYDKAAERGLLDDTHWVRVEVVLRDENALGAVQACLDKGEIGSVFGGILSNYLVYCDPQLDDDGKPFDSNKSRWPVSDYWALLLQGAAAIHIAARPGTEYNIWRLASYLRDQAGGAIYTWKQIYGLDSLDDLLKTRHSPLNPKHKRLIEQSIGSS